MNLSNDSEKNDARSKNNPMSGHFHEFKKIMSENISLYPKSGLDAMEYSVCSWYIYVSSYETRAIEHREAFLDLMTSTLKGIPGKIVARQRDVMEYYDQATSNISVNEKMEETQNLNENEKINTLSKNYINILKRCQKSSDDEVARFRADSTICDLLIELGFEDVVNEYHKVAKWYV